MSNKRIQSIYLAIALTSKCNYRCFYCKEGGESIANSKEEMSFEELKEILVVAYKLGITSFRITGGEPTMVSYFGELLHFIMKLGEDTKIRINTNGYNLMPYINIIELYKERCYVMISVDSLNEFVNGMYYPKYLSKKIENLTKELASRGIGIRYNVVVTKLNFPEIKPLLIKTLDEMKADIKLLDLNKYEEYLGGKEFIWNDLYISFETLIPFIESISDEYQSKYYQANSYGIPMNAYFRNGHMIQLKDSSKGTNYSQICRESCSYYETCRDGMFSPFLSTDLTLHVSGCKNKDIHFNLKGKDEYSIRDSFNKILELFETVSVQKK